MRVDRSNLGHRLAALTTGLIFAALAFGILPWLHLAQHEGEHHAGQCATCAVLSSHAKEIDPGTAPAVQTASASSEPVHVACESPLDLSCALRLQARSPPA